MPSTKRARKPRHPVQEEEQEAFVLGARRAPLSALENDELKDDNELELEAALFGKRRKPKRAKKSTAGAEEVEDSGLGYLQDHELFTIDAPLAESSASAAQAAFEMSDADESGEDEETGYEHPNFDEDSEDESDSDSDSEPDSDDSSAEPQPAFKSSKPALWEDPSDATVSVSLANDRRLRKLGRGEDLGDGQFVGGRDLEGRLRTQFEKLHPKPQWATAPKASASAPSTALAELLASTATMISAPKRRGPLPSGTLEIERLRDANQSNRTIGDKEGGKGGVVDLSWHPKLPVLSVVGGDRRLRLFNVDGHTNSSLLTIHVPSLPFTNTTFHPGGSSVLLTGTRPFYYTYDLESQRCLRSPRSLWGSSPTTSPQSLSTHAFSPDGTLLAVAGRRGALTVLSWGAAGASTVVAELKTGRTGGIRDLVFARGGRELWTLSGEGGEVDCWDLAERRVVRRWRDDGGFGGVKLAIGSDGTCAVGSTTGIVNLYSSSLATSSTPQSSLQTPETPTPTRTIGNLTTAISTLSFNHDNQLLLIGSKAKKDAFKMIHVPTGTAFANWPTSGTPLGHVHAAETSARGEYMAIGNQRGKVLLYSLKHWLD